MFSMILFIPPCHGQAVRFLLLQVSINERRFSLLLLSKERNLSVSELVTSVSLNIERERERESNGGASISVVGTVTLSPYLDETTTRHSFVHTLVPNGLKEDIEKKESWLRSLIYQ